MFSKTIFLSTYQVIRWPNDAIRRRRILSGRSRARRQTNSSTTGDIFSTEISGTNVSVIESKYYDFHSRNAVLFRLQCVNSYLRGQNGHHVADDIFLFILINLKFCVSIPILLKFITKGPIDNKSTLVQVMAWCRICDKPLIEPMLTQFTDAYIRL